MSVTREDVIWAYRMILGREPENENVIKEKLAHRDLNELRETILASPEFNSKKPRLAASPLGLLPMRPSRTIEVDVQDSDLEQLWKRIQNSWERLGANQPHHSVLTSDNFLPDNFKENEDAFWDSGSNDIDLIQDLTASAGLSLDGLSDCLEYGCGVGRVSMKLADLFKTVHALDISSPHLHLAQERAVKTNKKNVYFKKVEKDYFSKNHKYDFFFTRIVLQHNPPPIMKYILTSLLKNLRDGGIGIFQIPVHMSEYEWKFKDYIQNQKNDMEMHCIPQHEIFKILERNAVDIKEVRENTDIGNFGSWVSNIFLVHKPQLSS